MRRTTSAAVLLLTLALVWVTMTTANASTGPEDAVSAASANCGGHTVVSANYLRLANPAQTITGSIQLCRYPAASGYHYFARVQMYASLPRDHFANAFLYYYDPRGKYSVRSCDDNGGHVLPGRTLCYSAYVSNVRGNNRFRAVGREYRFNGHGWVLNSEGATIVVR